MKTWPSQNHHPDYNVAKIFELSCTVRGWNVRCFIDKKTAIRWLSA